MIFGKRTYLIILNYFFMTYELIIPYGTSTIQYNVILVVNVEILRVRYHTIEIYLFFIRLALMMPKTGLVFSTSFINQESNKLNRVYIKDDGN